MIEITRLTVIVDDSTVITDIGFYSPLDLSTCDIPEDVRALQWLNNKGEIEFRTVNDFKKPNEEITNLPAWAVKCLMIWKEAYDANPPPIYYSTMD